MKITIIALGVAILVAMGAYFVGGRVGTEKCRAEIANATNANVIAMQDEITKTKGRVNAETFNTGVPDIRVRLRKYWTIQD